MKKRSLAVKVTMAALAMIVLCTVAVGVPSYLLHRQDTVESSAREALQIAKSIAASMDGDALREIMDSGEKDSYWREKKDYIDAVKEQMDIAYLYVLDKEYDSNMTYFMEGVEASSDEEVYDLGHLEEVDIFADEMFQTLRTGEPTVTEVYPSGEFGKMVSGFAPVINSAGQVEGVVGVDMGIDHVLKNSREFGLRMIIIALLICALAAPLVMWFIRKGIGDPIQAVAMASNQISKGDMDVHLPGESRDEIGELVAAFGEMVDSTNRQVAVMEAIAGGDLTVDVHTRSDQDAMSHAMKRMIANLNNMFLDIKNGTMRVSYGAGRIAQDAESLAVGSTQQAASVEQLSAAIAEIAEKTKENATMAKMASGLSGTIQQNAKDGAQQLEQMTLAMAEINQANQSIGNVMKVIDDIAFQTNILALNAAVEAARAGQYGKGFAVVADEVRNLAAKSAQAAKQTEALIVDSIEKAQMGSKITKSTVEALNRIIQGVDESSRVVGQIARSSEEQAAAIVEINAGVEQVSNVVLQNSATSQTSAAASKEMHDQSAALQKQVGRFKISEDKSRIKDGKGFSIENSMYDRLEEMDTGFSVKTPTVS